MAQSEAVDPSRKKIEPPPRLLELIDRFEANKAAYKAPTYKEAQLRQEFLDPLLDLLGWDVDNKQGAAEPYKEVIHEDAIKIGGAAKAPDYCLRIGGQRKFFVEAKKPAVNLLEDPVPALQLRRYGWSAKLPLCILTDFEDLVVYDTRIRPKENDGVAVARILNISFKDFARRWDTIYNVFSREAVVKGSFDKWAESEKDKKGTSEVDDAFLAEIESWREDLAKNFALRNADLGQRELNYAVQSTIDRIIFLRICEDRGIETYGRLQALLEGEGTYERLQELFRLADERYNSGLFHFKQEKGRAQAPDTLTPSLKLEDKVLKPIIKNLYYPQSPYEFAIMPAEILGQVYEQFLGKVIRLTEGHRAKVEEKPEVRKAGGVYYTPTYIVDYIVKNTVGKLLEGKTPEQASEIRILDPACGSGSFLIGAYQYVLDWHLAAYVKEAESSKSRARYNLSFSKVRATDGF
jgi:N-6 DNA methylase/type I restriction and modification enzyme subunit R-like protein